MSKKLNTLVAILLLAGVFGWLTTKVMIKHEPTPAEKIQIISEIAKEYNQSHTYSKKDLFVCVDMAIDVWNMLKTRGINAKIWAGRVDEDITQLEPLPFLLQINHAWVMAETSPAQWVPVETTAGVIISPTESNFSLYKYGYPFENPRRFKEFVEMRNKLTETCNEAIKMAKTWDNYYVGRLRTVSSTQLSGRVAQKLDDCNRVFQDIGNLIKSQK